MQQFGDLSITLVALAVSNHGDCLKAKEVARGLYDKK